jgi:predicted XRE-type DNA-binding protein
VTNQVDVIEASSGNVFEDLGFEEPEIELVKARLSAKIANEVAARGWTQQKAAQVLGIDQPRVSLLVRGKTGQFSLERLIGFLELLNFDIRLEANPSPTTSRGHLVVAV